MISYYHIYVLLPTFLIPQTALYCNRSQSGGEQPFNCPIGPFAPGSVANGGDCCASEDCDVNLCGCLAPPSFRFCEVSGGMVDCNAECSGSSEDPDCTAVDHTGTCKFALVDECTEATKRTGRCIC